MFSGVLDMHATCPRCGLVFEREPGYFTGAMVVSYAIAVVVYGALGLGFWRLAGWPVEVSLAVAVLPFLASVPVIVRYSRVIWMHLDHALDPAK